MLANNSLKVTNTTEPALSCDRTGLEITFMVLDITASAIILFGNFLVFVAIVTSLTLRPQPMNQFLASLAVSDMIMGALVSPVYSLFCIGCLEYSLSKYCWLLESAKDLALASSILNLLAISYDRCCAVYYPLQYQILMTKKRVYSIICFIWGMTFFIAGIRHSWIHTKTGSELHTINSLYNILLILFIFFLPCIIITVINLKIIMTIRNQARQVFSLKNMHRQDAEVANQDDIQEEVTRKRKGTFACALVVLVFVVSWIPRVSFNIQYKLKGDLGGVNILLQKLSIFFLTVQSSVNPIIYSLYRSDFREAVVKLLKCNTN